MESQNSKGKTPNDTPKSSVVMLKPRPDEGREAFTKRAIEAFKRAGIIPANSTRQQKKD